MGSRAAAEKWLADLTKLPTAPGREEAVVAWVRAWVSRRPDLRITSDDGGNLLITQKGRRPAVPVLAVAHMDHPAFVVSGSEGRDVRYEFRGGVDQAYFSDARVEFSTAAGPVRGRVTSHEPEPGTGNVRLDRAAPIEEGDIGTWVFKRRRLPKGRFAAPACDDLAGVAASLAALDRARGNPARKHLGVLLTRAEEVGLVGAIHAARTGAADSSARLLSIETSRELPGARIGDGPIIRVGDAATIFDNDLTNTVTEAARATGLRHQRKLMDGGTCEATAFVSYGYRATGLCLALGNWHNRGNLEEVEAGNGEAVAMLEEISLDDFHGLIDLLGVAADAIRGDSAAARQRLEKPYQRRRSILD